MKAKQQGKKMKLNDNLIKDNFHLASLSKAGGSSSQAHKKSIEQLNIDN